MQSALTRKSCYTGGASVFIGRDRTTRARATLGPFRGSCVWNRPLLFLYLLLEDCPYGYHVGHGPEALRRAPRGL
jgi:hypothetical protein